MEKIITKTFYKKAGFGEIFDALLSETNKSVAEFISENVPINNKENVIYFTDKVSHFESVDFSNIRTIIHLKVLNRAKDINRHLMSINRLLPDAGMFVGCLESYYNRKRKITNKLGRSLGKVVWIIDLIINRILPKLEITKTIYRIVTGKQYWVISTAEALGRGVYCGFDVIAFTYIGYRTYFVFMKTCEPKDDKNPSFGPFFRMRRIGKNGKIIRVYKLRTMHPYSEYLQNYVVALNGYNQLGKPKEDFRITGWGKIVRKLWIDEIPQIVNLIKGDLNLVGVRPLSKFGFNSLPEDLQKERINYKPGIIPPNIALGLTGFEGVIQAERLYLQEMKKHPLRTNLKYFFLGLMKLLLKNNWSG